MKMPSNEQETNESGERKDLQNEIQKNRRSSKSNHRKILSQPEVTRFKKNSNHRTLVVSVLSLGLVITLAIVIDHLFSSLHHRDNPYSDTNTEPAAPSSQRTRTDLGMNTYPLEMPEISSIPEPKDNVSHHPIYLNKAAALKEAPADNYSSERLSSSPNIPSENHDDKSIKQQTEAQDTSEMSKIAKVRRIGLDPNLYIPVDSYIPCTINHRLVSDIGGSISCTIGEDTYSASNRVKLLPAGTIARGTYRTGSLAHGKGRMFILWTELRTPEPNALSIQLKETQATGPLGEKGVSGWVDNHFWQRFGNALMLSTVQDVAAAVSGSVPGTERHTDYTENSRSAAAEMAKTTLENSINIPPTLYLNQGDIIGIITGTDIDFSSVYRLRLRERFYD